MLAAIRRVPPVTLRNLTSRRWLHLIKIQVQRGNRSFGPVIRISQRQRRINSFIELSLSLALLMVGPVSCNSWVLIMSLTQEGHISWNIKKNVDCQSIEEEVLRP